MPDLATNINTNQRTQMVLKRLVAVAKARVEAGEAIRRCNEYLQLFASDTQAVGAESGGRRGVWGAHATHTHWPPPPINHSTTR